MILTFRTLSGQCREPSLVTQAQAGWSTTDSLVAWHISHWGQRPCVHHVPQGKPRMSHKYRLMTTMGHMLTKPSSMKLNQHLLQMAPIFQPKKPKVTFDQLLNKHRHTNKHLSHLGVRDTATHKKNLNVILRPKDTNAEQ